MGTSTQYTGSSYSPSTYSPSPSYSSHHTSTSSAYGVHRGKRRASFHSSTYSPSRSTVGHTGGYHTTSNYAVAGYDGGYRTPSSNGQPNRYTGGQGSGYLDSTSRRVQD